MTAPPPNPVPVIFGGRRKGQIVGPWVPTAHLRSGGGLADCCPPLLEILGLPQPATDDRTFVDPNQADVVTLRQSKPQALQV